MRSILGFFGVIFSLFTLFMMAMLPIVGAFIYSNGPEWIKAGNGIAIVVSFFFLGILLAVSSMGLLIKSLKAIGE